MAGFIIGCWGFFVFLLSSFLFGGGNIVEKLQAAIPFLCGFGILVIISRIIMLEEKEEKEERKKKKESYLNFINIFLENGVCVKGEFVEIKTDRIVVKYVCPFLNKEFLINSQIYDIKNIGLDYIIREMNIKSINVYVLKNLHKYIDKNNLDGELYDKLEDNMAYIDMNEIIKYVGKTNDIRHTGYIDCFYPYTIDKNKMLD